MLWPPSRLNVVLDNIVFVRGTVVLLVAMDPDSLCALHIFASLLKSENVPWETRAVRGFQDVDTFFADLAANPNSQIKSVVMLNCGGSVDLIDQYGPSLLHNLLIYVIDSRRPLAHRNMHSHNKQVFVLGNELDLSDLARLPEYEDDERELLAETNDLGEEQDDDDDDVAHPSASEEELDSGEIQDSPASARRRKRAKSPASPTMRAARLERLRLYYSGSYHRDPASHTVFQMGLQSGRQTKQALWLVLVGITHRYTSGDISRSAYTSFANYYSQTVAKIREEVVERPLPGGSNADHPGGDVRMAGATDDDGETVPVLEGLSIDFEEADIDLMLYRHWSLADALRYSDSTAGVLGAWKSDESETSLLRFLATIGVSRKHAEQKFTSMPAALRTMVPDKLKEHGERYKLGDLSFSSFVLRHGFSGKISAADVGYAAMALLECGIGEEAESHLHRFNKAYDVLDPVRNEHMLAAGISLSLGLQKLIVKEAVSLMRTKSIKLAGDFRFAIINASSDVSAQLYASPIAVVKLGRFLMHAHKANQKWLDKNAKPLVLAIYDPHSTFALVCGLPCPELGQVQQNAFAHNFRTIASKPEWKSKFRFESFDSSIVQLGQDHVMRFMFDLGEV